MLVLLLLKALVMEDSHIPTFRLSSVGIWDHEPYSTRRLLPYPLFGLPSFGLRIL